ncbi:MAG: hypothetical protein E7004_03920 [Alphaproteobacteria bacterium]|nr:hypothetical protein [Alphaproteobacteria bacterium]
MTSASQQKNPPFQVDFFVGWQDNTEIEEKSAQIYNVLVKNYNEILAMKDQVKFIKSMLSFPKTFSSF